MIGLGRYMRWLHTGWPAGTVERLPAVNDDGTTEVPGVRVVGDLTGIPLLKFSADTGARAVHGILAEPDFLKRKSRREQPAGDVLDVAIIGGGVSGIAAAIEAKKEGLSVAVYEAAQDFNTIWNFPKAKPIFTYPTEMTPAGSLQVTATVKEALFDELEAQRTAAGIATIHAHVDHIERKGGELAVVFGDAARAPQRALRVIVAIGRTGNYRQLGCPGEKLDKVYQRLHDPKEFAGKNVLVVGGGDSALESAIALAHAGAQVTLSYRKPEFSRPKPENLEKVKALDGKLRVLLGSKLKSITESNVQLTDGEGQPIIVPNDVVFAMIGREAPLGFFRRSGIAIRGEWRARTYIGCALFFAFCCLLYNWKSGLTLDKVWSEHHLFPYNVPSLGDSSLLRVLSVTWKEPSFYYSTVYCLLIGVFGWQRVKRRNTPYVRRQTLTLFAIQVIPLYLLPYIILPWLGRAGAFDHGVLKTVADGLFPLVNYGHGREYWRAFGLILAWPLFIYNFFTHQPNTWWLVIGSVQTFVLLPLAIRRWGKGVYCGWICSCGALAETLGDTQRQKMPHGPAWNRLNMVGQVILAVAFLMLIARIVSWIAPASTVGGFAGSLFDRMMESGSGVDYKHVVDVFLAGAVGVGFYFWFSGRVWCRFACPLAALMHIYARFSKFRIFAEKKKCISCNVCTSVCHQGIDVMSFANKGLPMEDPECVRCSACVSSCPTGTLSFGRFGDGDRPIYDRLAASPVQMAELKVGGDGKKRLPVVAA